MSAPRLARLGFALALVTATAGCLADAADDDSQGDAGAATDGNMGGPDATPTVACEMSAGFDPLSPEVDDTIRISGSIFKENVAGLDVYDWSIMHDGLEVPYFPRDDQEEQIEVTPDEAGPYRVTLTGFVGDTECASYSTTVNVREPGVVAPLYRLRVVPMAGHPAPPQERLIEIPGGADFEIGSIALDSGVLVSGVVAGPDGLPLPAYLRAAPTGVVGAPALEGFAGSSGSVTMRLLSGAYDLLVVPAVGGAAPTVQSGITALSFGSALALGAGDVVTGTVLGGSGQPLAGARVALAVGGVPSTIGITDAVGNFALRAHLGGATALTVVPPAGSALPQLEVTAGAGLVAAAGVPLAIRYRPQPIRALDLPIRLSGAGGAAATARVTLVARTFADVGTVTPAGGGELEAAGSLRAAVITDADGVATFDLPAAIYDVLVEPPPGPTVAGDAALLTAIDLSGATAPGELSFGPSATLTGTVLKPNGMGLGGVQVSAAPRGLLSGATRAAAETTTWASGAFELPLVGLGEYELTFRPPPASEYLGIARQVLTAPASGAAAVLDDVGLPRAIHVTGAITIPGIAGGAEGVYIALLCGDCTGAAASVPLADGVTGRGGAFKLYLPDPEPE